VGTTVLHVRAWDHNGNVSMVDVTYVVANPSSSASAASGSLAFTGVTARGLFGVGWAAAGLGIAIVMIGRRRRRARVTD
jgi:hypothetical protein